MDLHLRECGLLYVYRDTPVQTLAKVKWLTSSHLVLYLLPDPQRTQPTLLGKKCQVVAKILHRGRLVLHPDQISGGLWLCNQLVAK